MSNKIEKMTEEQALRVAEYHAAAMKTGLSCEPADYEAAEAVMREFYLAVAGKLPKLFIRATSPTNAVNIAREHGATELWPFSWGSVEAYWITHYRFPHEVLRKMHTKAQYKMLMLWQKLAESCGPIWTYENICIICDRPAEIHSDNAPIRRRHNTNGPAIRYRDGDEIYVWHGVNVPKWIIMEPHKITPDAIRKEKNDEIRRAMMSIYGEARYITDSGAAPIHADEYGILYRIPNAAEDVVCLRLLNSTVEPDGDMTVAEAQRVFGPAAEWTKKHKPTDRVKTYWKGVHPECRPMRMVNGVVQFGEPQKLTAKNAVASTFGLRGEEYGPRAES